MVGRATPAYNLGTKRLIEHTCGHKILLRFKYRYCPYCKQIVSGVDELLENWWMKTIPTGVQT